MRHVPPLLLAALLCLAPTPSLSAGFAKEKAMKAMERGDFKTALAEIRPHAEHGDPEAEVLLGMMYDAGRGVGQDQAAAASWYRKAAEQHHPLGQLFLGVLYCSGQGVKQDFAEGARWLRAAAESGNDEAQFQLGAMLARGDGVARDSTQAIRWLTRSAAQRNTRAMGLLVVELFNRSRDDRNDDQDLVDAYAWSHLAAETDPVQAMTSARALMEKYCSKEQAKRGKALMAEWKRKWSKEKKARTSGR